MSNRTTRSAFAILTAAALTCAGVRAGDLSPPPGPVQATDRVTLNEQSINLPYTISQPGSYVLTSDLAGVAGQPGIIVAANDVTLDLNGFTLRGVAGSLDGVRPGTGVWRNLTIRNGVIRDWGGNGVLAFFSNFPSDGFVQRTRYEGLTVTNNGGTGLAAGINGLITGCISRENGGNGFSLTNQSGILRDSVSADNTNDGVSAAEGVLIVGCSILSNDGDGVEVVNGNGHEVRSCVISANTGVGIRAFGATLVQHCQIDGNSGGGLTIFFGCHVSENTVTGNGMFGISGGNVAPAGRNHIESNLVSSNNGFGMTFPMNTGNVIVRNMVLGNVGGGISAAGSSAPTAADPAVAGPWHNIVQ